MGFAVVVLLGALWASILVPAAVRARRETSPIHTVDHFERSMGMLAPTRPTPLPGSGRPIPGRYIMVLDRPSRVAAPGASTVLERRRAILVRLVASVPVTGLLAVLIGGLFESLFLLAVLALGAYVALLLQLRARREEAARKLRRLPRGEGVTYQQRQRVAVGGR